MTLSLSLTRTRTRTLTPTLTPTLTLTLTLTVLQGEASLPETRRRGELAVHMLQVRG